MYAIDLAGKNGVVLGVANEHSIAWPIAQILQSAGANLAITYQNERFGNRVARMTKELNNPLLIECDVTKDDSITRAFETIPARLIASEQDLYLTLALGWDLDIDISSHNLESVLYILTGENDLQSCSRFHLDPGGHKLEPLGFDLNLFGGLLRTRLSHRFEGSRNHHSCGGAQNPDQQ